MYPGSKYPVLGVDLIAGLAGPQGRTPGPQGAPSSRLGPLAEIEGQLSRRFTDDNAPSRVEELSRNFDRLSPEQARDLFEQIFAAADRPGRRFYRLHRKLRAKLLLILARRLGHYQAERVHAVASGKSPLIGNQAAAEKRLKRLLREASDRQTFFEILQRTISRFHRHSNVPAVTLRIRTQGAWSRDNRSAVAATVHAGQSLGVDRSSGKNWIEIRGDVSGHRPDVQYRLRRTIEHNSWYRRGKSVWAPYRVTQNDNYDPPGTPDDGNDTDEDATPEQNHIYSVDGPGYAPIRPDFPANDKKFANTTAFLSMLNAIEIAEIRIGKGTWQEADTIEWCSIIGAEVVGGRWQRKAGSDFNAIHAGSRFIGNSKHPPVSW